MSVCLADLSEWMSTHQHEVESGLDWAALPSKEGISHAQPLYQHLELCGVRSSDSRMQRSGWSSISPRSPRPALLLCPLHWLLVAARIWLKTLVLAYHPVNGTDPSYIQDIDQTIHPNPSPCSATAKQLATPSLQYQQNHLCRNSTHRPSQTENVRQTAPWPLKIINKKYLIDFKCSTCSVYLIKLMCMILARELYLFTKKHNCRWVT